MDPLAVKISVNPNSMKELARALSGPDIEKHMVRNLRAAVNKTAKTVRVQVARELGKVMYLKSNYDPGFQKANTLKKVIKAKSWATLEDQTAVIQLSPGYEFPLKYYGAKPFVRKRKGKKIYEGVTYRFQPGKANAAWKKQRRLVDAFVISRFNNNVYRREGLARLPIRKAVGPAPGDYYEQIKARELAISVARDRLPKEVRRRVRAIMLERQGIIKLRSSRGLS